MIPNPSTTNHTPISTTAAPSGRADGAWVSVAEPLEANQNASTRFDPLTDSGQITAHASDTSSDSEMGTPNPDHSLHPEPTEPTLAPPDPQTEARVPSAPETPVPQGIPSPSAKAEGGPDANPTPPTGPSSEGETKSTALEEQQPEPSAIPAPHPEVTPEDRAAQAALDRLSGEGIWGRLAAGLAKRARWSATRPGFFEPFHSDALREMRREGKRVFPLRPVLAWDEHETSEPPSVLKNDWRALWMRDLSGHMATSLDAATLARFPTIHPHPGDRYALSFNTAGAITGVVELHCQNGVWLDREWRTDGPEADRTLLALVLRFARDGKRTIALKYAPVPLAMERGAFWAWEWAVAPNSGGLWGRLAGGAFSWRARVLSAQARKQARAIPKE